MGLACALIYIWKQTQNYDAPITRCNAPKTTKQYLPWYSIPFRISFIETPLGLFVASEIVFFLIISKYNVITDKILKIKTNSWSKCFDWRNENPSKTLFHTLVEVFFYWSREWPVYHCDIRTSPVTPPTGAPWYAIQSTVTLTYVFLSFYPAAITQAVNPLLITLSIHDTAASWTWDLLLVLIWLTVICTWMGLSW